MHLHHHTQSEEETRLVEPPSNCSSPVIITYHYSRQRWVALTLASIMMFAGTYSLWILFAVQERLTQAENHSFAWIGSNYDVLMLYYHIAGAVLALTVGFASDKIGIRRCLFLAVVMTVIGQALICAGINQAQASLVVTGKLFFSSYEVVYVTLSKAVCEVFPKKEYGTAIGIMNGVGLLGAVVSIVISPAGVSFANAFVGGMVVSILLLVLCLVFYGSAYSDGSNVLSRTPNQSGNPLQPCDELRQAVLVACSQQLVLLLLPLCLHVQRLQRSTQEVRYQ